MIEQTKDILSTLYLSLDNEAKRLNELKSNLVKGEEYEAAKSIHRIESEVLSVQNMICNLLDEITSPERKEELFDKQFRHSLNKPD